MTRRRHRVQPQLLTFAREMRRDPATAERILWNHLRDRQLEGLKFRRQYAIENYIADFYCADRKLVIELDGESHQDQQAYDEQRTMDLSARGVSVIRFSNMDLFENIDGVLNQILEACDCLVPHVTGPSPRPSPPLTRERGKRA